MERTKKLKARENEDWRKKHSRWKKELEGTRKKNPGNLKAQCKLKNYIYTTDLIRKGYLALKQSDSEGLHSWKRTGNFAPDTSDPIPSPETVIHTIMAYKTSYQQGNEVGIYFPPTLALGLCVSPLSAKERFIPDGNAGIQLAQHHLSLLCRYLTPAGPGGEWYGRSLAQRNADVLSQSSLEDRERCRSFLCIRSSWNSVFFLPSHLRCSSVCLSGPLFICLLVCLSVSFTQFYHKTTALGSFIQASTFIFFLKLEVHWTVCFPGCSNHLSSRSYYRSQCYEYLVYARN